MKIKHFFLQPVVVIGVALFLSSCAQFSAPGKLYSEARVLVREDREYFAFLRLQELVRDYPQYKDAAEARFALGEYHFQTGNYDLSLSHFVKFINDYPDSEMIIFAKAFVYKMIQEQLVEFSPESGAEVSKAIREELFSRPAFFVFSEYRQTQVRTFLNTHYELKEYVNKIEILQNGSVFLRVSP